MAYGQRNYEAKWAKHYSSDHQILLVGEGDFSFSLSLAMVFGSASNIVATSLDSYELVIKKYKRAKTNLEILYRSGAQLLYGVDASTMKHHTHLQMRKFDRIIFNFPHAGFLGKEDDQQVIREHQNLVRAFFENACHMLRPGGEVHVSHKTTAPFMTWDIEDLAYKSSLSLLECVEFKIADYPGYNNKRGDGSRCDEPFPLGECSTFKFVLTNNNNLRYEQCRWVFKEYFDQEVSMFGKADDHLLYSVPAMLDIGFERWKTVNPVNPFSDYVNLVRELRNRSNERIAYLQSRLLETDHHWYG